MADISSYLAAAGWVRQPDRWRGAAIWVHEGDHEVLVPPRDDMGDIDRRIREIVGVLAAVEVRTREAVTVDIASPMVDVQWYRSPTDDRDGTGETSGGPDGSLGLSAALDTLQGARDVLRAATRVVLGGPHVTFAGALPREAREFLDRVRLAPFTSPDQFLTVRFPLTDVDSRPGPANRPGGDPQPGGSCPVRPPARVASVALVALVRWPGGS